MNISIKGDSKKKSQKLGYGLNNRSKNPVGNNVFGNDDDDDDDDDSSSNSNSDNDKNTSRRNQVNRQIAAEQAALRKRAQAAAAAVSDPSIYDYDGAYDSFQNRESNKQQDDNNNNNNNRTNNSEPKKSRYIQDLLAASKKRQYERDLIYERRIQKEQAEENEQAEYQGKEMFVTRAYKRKLEERKLWQQEQEQQEMEDAKNDVTKKSQGEAFGSFYGNFNKNISMGGQQDKEQEESLENNNNNNKNDKDEFKNNVASSGLGFLDGFEMSSNKESQQDGNELNDDTTIPLQESIKETANKSTTTTTPRLSMREIREEKIAEARIRYLERRRLNQVEFGKQ